MGIKLSASKRKTRKDGGAKYRVVTGISKNTYYDKTKKKNVTTYRYYRKIVRN